jgi:predicted small metal-binding protein
VSYTKDTLQCPCGETIKGASEDDLVAKAIDHLKAAHPEMADRYTRDDILFMAY